MSTATLPARIGCEKLLTVADLASFPRTLPSGDVLYELDDGKLVIMAPPGDSHSRRQFKILQYLGNLGEDRGYGEARGDVAIVLRRDPDRVVSPDAAFILKSSLPVKLSNDGYLETIPELVVEIRSKNDLHPAITTKNEEYFDAGVKLVWLIDPDVHAVTALQRGMDGQVFQELDTLTCPLIPGFAVPVANLFTGS